LLLFALAAAPALAQDPGAEAAISGQRAVLREAMRLDCPPAEDADEIVVCGSRDEENRRNRLPLAVGPPPGAADRAGGEQRAAMAIDSSSCTTVGRDQRCNGGLDMIGIGFTIARAIAQAIVNDD
jgi:hypothetical protein